MVFMLFILLNSKTIFDENQQNQKKKIIKKKERSEEKLQSHISCHVMFHTVT